MQFTKKAELHCHCTNSNARFESFPRFFDSVQTIEEIFSELKKKNIKILALTDHDTLEGYNQAKKYMEKNNINDVLLIPACEITTNHGHILAYGITQAIPKDLSPEETIKKIHEQGGIAVAAHPFHLKMGVSNKLYDLNVDAVEGYNSGLFKFLNSNEKAVKAAKKLNLPYIASSDAHYFIDVGNYVTIFPESVTTVEDVIRCIKTGQFEIELNRATTFETYIHYIKRNFKNALTNYNPPSY
jgi:predicted metal-dependent phosphoesterase TrpH